MSQATLSPTALPGQQSDRTVADLLHRLGDIPASRVLDSDESATLDGGDLLPGFTLPLLELFTRASRRRGSGQ